MGGCIFLPKAFSTCFEIVLFLIWQRDQVLGVSVRVCADAIAICSPMVAQRIRFAAPRWLFVCACAVLLSFACCNPVFLPRNRIAAAMLLFGLFFSFPFFLSFFTMLLFFSAFFGAKIQFAGLHLLCANGCPGGFFTWLWRVRGKSEASRRKVLKRKNL